MVIHISPLFINTKLWWLTLFFVFAINCYSVVAQDTDADSISDFVDLDDDNDGILDIVEGCETTDISGTIGIGNPVPNNVTYPLAGTDVTYTLNNPDFMNISGYDAGENGHSIILEADTGDSGAMTTSYSTPISGVQFKLTDFDQRSEYTIEVYNDTNTLYDLTSEGVVFLGSRISQTGNYFEADPGDTDGDILADDAFGAIYFYFSSTVSRIEFTFNHPVNSSTRFTQPMYCIRDTDTDGIPDSQDLDSDGDGIPDNVEAQTTLGYIPPNADDVATYAANNGVNSAYLGGLTPVNADTADTPDYIDTNSDNEGAPDAAEAGLFPANADVDNDGLDDATDADISGYADPGGTVDDPLIGAVILPDEDTDARIGGDIDFRDTTDSRLDSDNDGTFDVVDIDDDNDGIPDDIENATCYSGPSSGALFTEDFGAGDRTTTPYTNYLYQPDDWPNDGGNLGDGDYAVLNDIRNSANWAPTVWVDAPDHTGNPNGRMALFNASYSPAEEFYNRGNINVTPNVALEFSFWVKNVDRATQPNTRILPNITVYVRDNSGAVTLETFSTGNVAKDEAWHKYNFTFDPGSNSQIRFVLVNNASGGHGNDLVLDDIGIRLLCDADADGVTNSLDLDSDNDGILDIVESGVLDQGTVDSDSDGKIDGIPGNFGTNGLYNGIESDDTATATLTYSVAESSDDSDSFLDFLDLDSDGDGIPDNVEAQTTLGYTFPNPDDATTYETNQGVNSAYLGGLEPVNTDAVDNPDYLDLDSDNEGGNDTAEAAITLSGDDIDSDGLDDATDADISSYTDPGGTIDNPLSAPVILPDADGDAISGGDVDFRDATDDTPLIDLDSDDDGILDSFEDLNADGDNDPSTDPTNSDGDLYPDYFDIDSDNDGIPDNVEAQTTSDYIAPSLLDVNNNGLDDAYEEGVRMGLIPINTDGEDFPDYLDADSDNDNVPDAIEGHDHNHDGVADVSFIGSDKDDDGLDDGYEGAVQIDADVNDEIDYPLNDLPDTDGDGESDYRNIDDDNDGIPTREEDANNDGNYANDDVDNDGTPDYLEANYPEVIVYNVVTPNADGVHDFLMITGLDIRPNNSIKIFNRWGILVYETEAYDSRGNHFEGTSQARATIGKEEKLPAGTYFYMLNYEDLQGGNKTLSGHLYLN